MKKGQSAIEFLIIVGFALFFITLFIIGIQQNTQDKVKANRIADMTDIANSVSDEINIAYSAGNGYSRNFTVPTSILNGVPYNIYIDGTLLNIQTTDLTDSMAIPIRNVTGDVKKGNNLILNINDNVYLNSRPCSSPLHWDDSQGKCV